jgi:hypothetical protein
MSKRALDRYEVACTLLADRTPNNGEAKLVALTPNV